ncbi:DUF1800 domain-containing protein [Ampullimonas aquatilis]|uniref:DUF1800 domain-containing protein n=1 Tax=Ampullimonas aquatilis TaxID=1341549 RepID=UPI003C730A4F
MSYKTSTWLVLFSLLFSWTINVFAVAGDDIPAGDFSAVNFLYVSQDSASSSTGRREKISYQKASKDSTLGWQRAQTLLLRTGFAASPDEIAHYAGLTQSAAVNQLLAGARTEAITPWPDWLRNPPTAASDYRAMSDEDKKAEREAEKLRGLDLRAWWLTEMIHTPSPLTERMTLFWHDHFVSSQQKIKISQVMARQNATLRRYALGNFGDLLHAMAKDPAMLIYLDGATSKKENPNENFAREVMELFTLGEGHYSETDIKEAARALTGWSVERDDYTFRLRPAWHDNGTKTIFGQTGNFDGDGVMDLLLARPETAQFIVGKLWREFISPEPDAAEIARIAAIWRNQHYDMKSVLRELFNTPAMLDERNQATLIKSPVELLVGTIRALQIEVDDTRPLAIRAAQFGQNLFSPPNVKGWPGGEVWINSTTLLARQQFVEQLLSMVESNRMHDAMMQAMPVADSGNKKFDQKRLLRASGSAAKWRFDAQDWLQQLGCPADAPLDAAQLAKLQQTLLVTEPVAPMTNGANGTSAANGLVSLRRVLLDATYQVK